MSFAVSVVVRRLAEENITAAVTSTENCSNEMPMLNQARGESIQARTRLPILRIACRAQTLNLALHELMNKRKITQQLLKRSIRLL
jgi:hypothetical protein